MDYIKQLVLIIEMKLILNLTDHYFTGDYPVKPIDELGDNKVTQLSLLSTASNN
jgi:hypothetical protein